MSRYTDDILRTQFSVVVLISLVISLTSGYFGVAINLTRVRKPVHANRLAFSALFERVVRRAVIIRTSSSFSTVRFYPLDL